MEQISLHYFKEAGCDLFAPGSFVFAADSERALICNGCGTKGIGGYIVPDSLWGLNITLVCNIHDWMYELCDTDEEEDLADYYFKCNLRRLIKNHKSRLTPFRLLRANIYFIAVSATYFAPYLKSKIKRTG